MAKLNQLTNNLIVIQAILGEDLGFEIVETESTDCRFHQYVFFCKPLVKDWLRENLKERREEYRKDGIAACLDSDGVWASTNLENAIKQIMEAYGVWRS